MTMTNTAPHKDSHSASDSLLDVIIIGAGIAGIRAGQVLQDAGLSVHLLDKGRRIGGRCATRRSAGYLFNHGAQFFTAADDTFQSAVLDAQTKGAVAAWDIGHHKPTYIGTPSMRDFATALAGSLPITQEVKITSLTSDNGVTHLTDEAGKHYRAKHVIVTAPAPQAAALVTLAAPELAKTAISASYDPCWTVMLGLAHAPDVSHAIIRDAAPIGWACLEQARDIQMQLPALTIQADPDESIALLDKTAEEVCARLIAAYEDHTKVTLDISHRSAHRWLYARVAQPADHTAPYATEDAGIVLAGDWFGKARLETAFLSGSRAAHTILQARA